MLECVSAAPMILLFGMSCAGPCESSAAERARLEAEVVSVVAARGYAVRIADPSIPRPTGASASPEPIDVAAHLGVDRVLVLDLDSKGHELWATHFVRGVPGAWSLGRAVCSRSDGAIECGNLESVVTVGLRPRKSSDIDLVGVLRMQAKRVGECVLAEDQVPIDERIFGRLEMSLEVMPTGSVRLRGVIPPRVQRVVLGRCLKDAVESMSVGVFDGDPIHLKVPIDLD